MELLWVCAFQVHTLLVVTQSLLALFWIQPLTATPSSWIVILRLPESTSKARIPKTIKKNAHMSYPLDHQYFVPHKPQRLILWKKGRMKWRSMKYKIWSMQAAITCIKPPIFFGKKFMFNCLVRQSLPCGGWVGACPLRRTKKDLLGTPYPACHLYRNESLLRAKITFHSQGYLPGHSCSPWKSASLVVCTFLT